MNNQKHNRRSIRLKGYDYSQAGAYFITICTQNRECLFGEIVEGEMVLNKFGEVVNDFCTRTESHFKNITFDSSVIMPNHFHAIINIVGAGSPRPIDDPIQNIKSPAVIEVQAGSPRPIDDPIQNGRNDGRNYDGRGNPAPTVGNIVGYFKYQTTKQINNIKQIPGTKLWQRNYYEHIIRNENDYNRIYEYTQNNPLQWELDSLHPNNVGADSISAQNGE